METKLIKLADRLEYEWWTVEEYKEDALAKDSDNEKRIAKSRVQCGEEAEKGCNQDSLK